MASYLSQKVKFIDSKIAGKGLVATELIKSGELLIDYSTGKGEYVTSEKAEELFNEGNDHMIQVDWDLFFAAVGEGDFEEADAVNHSCEPNCGIKNKLQIVAMRNIHPGEEITIDYSMMESSDFTFECHCGNVSCRGVVTGNDWKKENLQQKYQGFVSGYLIQKSNA